MSTLAVGFLGCDESLCVYMYPMNYGFCTNAEEPKHLSRIGPGDLDHLASLGHLVPFCGRSVIPKAADCANQNNGIMGKCSLGVMHSCGPMYMPAMLHSD